MKLTPPTAEEAAPYYFGYIDLAVERGDVITALPKQIAELNTMLGSLSDDQALYKHAPIEWTIKEVVGHLIDAERIFAYRLTCISRNEKNPLPGFEQDDYVREANFNNYSIKDLLQEFEFVRRANIIAINYLTDTAVNNHGTASGNPVSVRALIYMMVGHVDHHIKSLKKEYLPKI